MAPVPAKDPSPANASPEPTPSPPKFLLDRYEGGLIVLLLALVAGTHFSDQLLPGSASPQLEIVRGGDSTQLGPVNLRGPVDPKPLPHRDLNKVSKRELTAISGIGPAMADAILSHREANGPFRSLEELLRVPGIGPKRLELFSNHLFVEAVESEGPEAAGLAVVPPIKTSNSESKEGSPGTVIDLNQASRADLLRVPGIGETFASRILEQRDRLGGFRSWDDVERVSGVGPKRLENLRTYATID